MAFTPMEKFLTNSMVRYTAHFDVMKEEELNIYDLEVRSEDIRKLWKLVEETFNNCLSHVESPEDTV